MKTFYNAGKWTNPNYGEPFSGSRKDTIVEDQQRWKKAL